MRWDVCPFKGKQWKKLIEKELHDSCLFAWPHNEAVLREIEFARQNKRCHYPRAYSCSEDYFFLIVFKGIDVTHDTIILSLAAVHGVITGVASNVFGREQLRLSPLFKSEVRLQARDIPMSGYVSEPGDAGRLERSVQ